MIVLEARRVSRFFATGGRRLPALAPVSVSLEAGTFLVVTGPSGSGKSTFLNLLSGLDQPSQGEVLYRGEPLHAFTGVELARFRNQRFGFVFQTPHVLTNKTVLENVALPANYGPPEDRETVHARCRALLEYVGLGGMEAREPNTLSGGELQRVVTARALLHDPEILFADEPTGNLDADNARRILELLRDQAAAGRVVVMVTHERDAVRYGNRELRLEKCAEACDA